MLAEKHTFDKPNCLSEGVVSIGVTEISLDSIEWRDMSTFVRCGMDGDQVENLQAAYEAGEDVPPVDLFSEKVQSEDATGIESRVRYYIGDGWHRFHAAREIGREVIPALVHSGGKREALRFALGANAAHGLRRTNRDKRKAVEVALREFPNLSNRAIAELCRVGPSMVNGVRPQLPDSGSSRVGKDGKVRRVDAAGPVSIANGQPTQLDFFELVGREWLPVVRGFDMTIQSVAWLDDRVAPEKKLEALSAMRRQLDGMRVQIAERERAIKTGLGNHEGTTKVALRESDNVCAREGVTS
jgi:uncharacterized ParB-like nuclease family protein